MSKKLSVKEVLNSFDFNVVNKGKANSRYITCSGIARVGIELTAKVKPAYKKQSNPVSFGRSELNYFNNCSKSDLHRAIKRIKALDPPMIILNSSFGPQDVKMILKEFGKTDITIAHINMSSADLYFEISPWIAKKIAPTSVVHATLLSIYGVGVLITGESGTGKSEAAMELLKTGTMFVGDDAIEVYNVGRTLFGRPTSIAKQFIEVRGLGILDISRMFGWQKTLQETRVHMIVQLSNPSSIRKRPNDFERVGVEQKFEKIRGVQLPKYSIPITTGSATASLIESAVVNYKLKQAGYNSADSYLQNYEKILKKGKR